jgi:putative thioredoxin
MNETPQAMIATLENFASAVIGTSDRMPVLVDFWASWCAPCRALMPVLERIAADYAGRLQLVKLNIDEEQELAAHFGIRSVPTVLLIHHGNVVDQFTGVQPDAAIRAMLDRHVSPAARSAHTGEPIARAHALAQAGDRAAAIGTLEAALAEQPEEPVLLAALAGLQLLARDVTAASDSIDRIARRDPQFPALAALRTRLGFLEAAASSPGAARSSAALAANPADSAARHTLAIHHAVAGDYTAALEEWLTLMQHDRAYGDDAARRSMLAVFELLGSDDERVATFRRRMASLLH